MRFWYCSNTRYKSQRALQCPISISNSIVSHSEWALWFFLFVLCSRTIIVGQKKGCNKAAIALALRDKLCVSRQENKKEKQKENRTKYEYTNCKGLPKKILSAAVWVTPNEIKWKTFVWLKLVNLFEVLRHNIVWLHLSHSLE